MPKYRYYQCVGGEETWKPCPVGFQAQLEAEKNPAFFTALSVSQLADDLAPEDRDKLKYSGSLYFDWDGEDMVAVAEQVHKLCLMLEHKGLDMASVQLYATGGRGFHLEIPMACFMAKVPKDGIQHLPTIYKQLAFEVAVDFLDFRVYSGGRGRMWRSCGVKRENGHYKVPITYEELQGITLESYGELTSLPRLLPAAQNPQICLELMVMFDHAHQMVIDRLKKRKKKNTDTSVLRKQDLPSLQALLEGRGVKDGAGFHQIALQLAIVAEAMGWTETELADKAVGLCQLHTGDSDRYRSEGARRAELIRMHRYMGGNPCYEFSIGGLKSLLSHDAPDLDGIPVTKVEVEEGIKQAAEEPKESTEELLDEYADVAGAVHLSKFGLYANTEEGKKRICAVSFDNVHILKSPYTGLVSCYEADVLINGKQVGRQVLELDIFGGLQAFNKFAGRHSHSLQGSDQHVRGMMMRVAENGKKKGKELYVVNREGLDIINVVNHVDPEMREPFMIWADNKGVVLEPRIAAKGYQFSFQGFPDARGAFRTDMSDAPALIDWLEVPDNKESLRVFLRNFIGCQQPSFIAKELGWFTASFYRMIFHKVYGKFPILHVNGAAGAGKCLALDTPVLMADKSVKKVQDIVVGDRLFGSGGDYRTVLSLARGREQMYRVKQAVGDDYVVNASHDLALMNEGEDFPLNDGRTANGWLCLKLNVREFYELSDARKAQLRGTRFHPSPGYVLTHEILSVQAEGIGDYYGFQLDGDHRFFLGDGTLTYNTEINKLLLSFFFYQQEGKMLTPGSTLFALQQHLSGSSSIPLIIDEYKPQDMPVEMHGKLKLMMRDAYNCREVTRGGGSRDSDDYRALHSQQLSAPMVVIAEAAEQEAAVMERVVLATMVRPPASIAMKWSTRFHIAEREKRALSSLGHYIASGIVLDYSIEQLRDEFDALQLEAQEKYMLSEKDLVSGLPEAEIQAKQGAKERTVYNYTVARFGLQKLRKLVADIFDQEFEEAFEELESSIYDRMTDLLPSTQAEWIKVLNVMAVMSAGVEPSAPMAIRKGHEYQFLIHQGKSAIELSARISYHRYRAYCRTTSDKPLFPGEHAFAHALKDCPALLHQGPGETLAVPGGSYIFDLEELSRMGVYDFKER